MAVSPTVTPLEVPEVDERSWIPKIDELIDEACERAGINKESENTVFWNSALRSIQLIQTKWATGTAYIPTVFEYKFNLIQGEADYNLPPGTLGVVTSSIRDPDSDADILLRELSYAEWQNIPYKEGRQRQQERPYRYLLDLRATENADGNPQGPRIRFWYAPDQDYEVSFQLEMMPKRIENATQSIETAERWYEAFVAELSARLCLKFGDADRYGILRGEADGCMAEAQKRDTTSRPLKTKYARWF